MHKHMKTFVALDEKEKRLDKPIDWLSLKDHDIPRDATAFLFSIWAADFRATASDVTTSGGSLLWAEDLPLARREMCTGREARWWWRIHECAPDAPPYIVTVAGQIAAQLERGDRMAGESRDWTPLWVFMACQPWADQKHAEEYEGQIKAGAVQRGMFRIRRPFPKADYALMEHTYDGDSWTINMMMTGWERDEAPDGEEQS